MELWTAFILGLGGSLHCAGMCGPLVFALSMTRRDALARTLVSAGSRVFQPAGCPESTSTAGLENGSPTGKSAKQQAGKSALPGLRHGWWNTTTQTAQLLGRLAYNLGRLTTYGLLGVVFGLFGQVLAVAGFQRWVSIGAGAVMLLSLLAWPGRRATVVFTRPVGWLKTQLGDLLRRGTIRAQFLVGVLNGLLPCGLVYVACAAAAATGGLVAGIEFMLVFGLGTLPMMLGLGLAGPFLSRPLGAKFQRLMPAGALVLAALLILRGLALGIPYVSPGLPGNDGKAACCHSAR